MVDKDDLKKEIMNHVFELDIAGYLKDEVELFLGYFYYFKLKNILSNIDFLKDYLVFLDHKSTRQIHQLDHDSHYNLEDADHDLNYYASKKGLKLIGKNKLRQKIRQKSFNISSIMLGIKGFLLLTIDEFCNATPTRLSINKLMLEKELDKGDLTTDNG